MCFSMIQPPPPRGRFLKHLLLNPSVPRREGAEIKIRRRLSFNPLVPRVQKIKIRNLSLNQLLIVEFVKKMDHFGAHYCERQGLMG